MTTYFITGSEGVGKTTVVNGLKRKFPKMKIYDFDEVGVPENPPLQWRLDTTLLWIKKSIENQSKEISTCIVGLSFPSEIKSYKESQKLNEIVFILLDINEEERKSRLLKRGASKEVIEDLEQFKKIKKEFEGSVNKIDTSMLSKREVLKSLCDFIEIKNSES